MSTIINILVTIIMVPWPVIIMMSPMMIASTGFRDNRSSLLFATFLMGYPVIVFTFLKVIDYGFWGMSVNWWLILVSGISGGIIFLYGIPRMLLNLRWGIQNNSYFKNDSAVFFDGYKISGADPVSFSILTTGSFYAKDSKHVFYLGKIVKGADPLTFAPVKWIDADFSDNSIPVYWKDKANVYFNAKKIEGCDAGTFQNLRGIYGKDRNYVYYGNNTLPKANPEKFRFLNDGITTDETYLFIFDKLVNTPIDLSTFTVVENGDHVFCKDKNHIYLLLYGQQDSLVKVDGADADTFTLLDRYYAKDKHNVYYYGYNKNNKRTLIFLTDADPDKFSVGYDASKNSEATDGLNYYMTGKSVRV
ncbi:MAG: DKNYY domain-containing protein [Sporocytophaga sp.]|uniref:DKNYY domain-containing protein n=1 Tax=Sporocytophaga sp. TaxID=2231183 RepID=UPI001B007B56|nr:DKNYY domain-containing protein [Sporocytophaga sp.]MBO9702230.1 DKNYY domain-containing protein [Sporocytophaga sp.]